MNVNDLFDMIKMAYVSLSGSDSPLKGVPDVQVEYNGKTKEALNLTPYGLCSRPPVDSLSVCFNPWADEAKMFVMSNDYANRLGKTTLKEGEVITGNYKSVAFTYYDNSGQSSLMGDKIYAGSLAVGLVDEIIAALEVLETATYPSAVGPAGPMVPPDSLLLRASIDKLETIKGSVPIVT